VYDVIETMAAQSWSNQKVGMIGGSYDGTTTYAAAVMHPPHLVTIVPEAAIDRWYDYAFANGVRYSYTTEPFGYEGPGTAGDEGIDTPAGFSFGLAIPPPIDEQDPTWAQQVESRIAVCQQVQQTMEGYSTTPDYSAFWQARDYLDGPPGAHQGLSDVTIPVLVASNYGDWNVKQVDGWQAFHTLTSSQFARMYYGSRWHGHGTPPNTGTSCTQYDANTATVDRWFAHWLQGTDNGLETMPVVTTATTDSSGPTHDSYTCGAELAPAQVPLYLEHNGDGTWALSPDAAAAPAGSPQATIDWTGTNTETNEVLHPYAPDSRYLSFTSPVLTQDVRIYGEPQLHLWSTIQRTWITYTPRLVDFDPSKYTGSGPTTESTTANAIPAMTRGWMDTRYRNGLAGPASCTATPSQCVTPGQSFLTDVPLWPHDYTVRAGHRLILILSTETADWDVPKLSTSTDTGAPTAQINYEQSQSYITIPMVGVTSGDALFSSAANVPDAPWAPLLLLAGLPIGCAAIARRRLRRRVADPES
ncbi:MAG: CocE/NonD family hydrolase, partial [Candidatus Dormibacteria bacterium]